MNTAKHPFELSQSYFSCVRGILSFQKVHQKSKEQKKSRSRGQNKASYLPNTDLRTVLQAAIRVKQKETCQELWGRSQVDLKASSAWAIQTAS